MKRKTKKSMLYYVRISDEVGTDEVVEVPTENDGTLQLSSVSAQFPGAVGLRFKAESGSWRGCRVDGNIIDPPLDGWGDDTEYYVIKNPLKRGHNDDDGPMGKMQKEDMLSDLMIRGLPYSATEDEVRKHFESYGELDMFEIKYDRDGKSRGFAFLRYKTMEAVEAALSGTHILHNRRCDIRYPKRSQAQQIEENVITPIKLFVGRLPSGTSREDLQEHFSKFGVLKDVYIPNPFRGYGFVTFATETAARKVMHDTHKMKGTFLNVNFSNEKKMDGMLGQPNPGFGNMLCGGFETMPFGMQGNMQVMGNMFGNMPGMNSQSWRQAPKRYDVNR